MPDQTSPAFEPLNRGFDATFRPGRLSIGLVVPLAAYPHSAVPDMARHMDLARLADGLGFSALWLRDVPFNVPSFGDARQVFDPFVHLGALAASTRDIALGVASVVLPPAPPRPCGQGGGLCGRAFGWAASARHRLRRPAR
ncbi:MULTISPECIES: LLM class flavin-dependent oxidoreductase [unclassified Roseivivax]|uniref:LLM class flavin-dependent oxidoreductase n=1 Tax=unclassified Roseivivax TaxID=2639302 RepID=UPI0020C801A9|nr:MULTISPECIES: LLM class flavin-dependent oxidoreductase [unclassified Roseivivax]